MAESLLLFQLLPLEFRPIPKLPQNSADCISLFIFVFLFLSVFSKGTLWARPNPYKYIYYERPQLKGGTAAEARKESRNIGIKLRDHVRLAMNGVPFLSCFWTNESLPSSQWFENVPSPHSAYSMNRTKIWLCSGVASQVLVRYSPSA